MAATDPNVSLGQGRRISISSVAQLTARVGPRGSRPGGFKCFHLPATKKGQKYEYSILFINEFHEYTLMSFDYLYDFEALRDMNEVTE